ncbi:hypothetical protein LBMAG42_55610 [Deltaproteobacteria bacterium]|nr:hypothetical protein LBMAG42_55610 [Deltaproteobacteria bacterium]
MSVNDSVLAFEVERFRLGDDIRGMWASHRLLASEGTVLYAARILEALVGLAAERAVESAAGTIFSALETIRSLSLIGDDALVFAHALRRLANDVRHVRRRIHPTEADFAIGAVGRTLRWYFCESRFGPGLASISDHENPFAIAPEFLPEALLTGGWETAPVPAIPALLVERHLDQGSLDAAAELVGRALRLFPCDLRLRQLEALLLSRRGTLEVASERIAALSIAHPDDEETIGIASGIQKRRAFAEDDQVIMLAAHRGYRDGWMRSRRRNAWLGINAAATALWANRPALSRRLARETKEFVEWWELRRRGLGMGGESALWDLLTQAEATLLLGEFAAARAGYGRAIAAHPNQEGAHRVALWQAAQVLGAFSPGAAVADLPHPQVGGAQRAAGITGHRKVDGNSVGFGIVEALDELSAAGFSVLVSSLAEGSDTLVAQQALARGWALEVLLPMEIGPYIATFTDSAHETTFRRLLRSASRVLILESRVTELAFRVCGLELLERCEVLIAIWDGEAARGPGGTGEVVAQARSKGRTVAWIASGDGALRWEGSTLT